MFVERVNHFKIITESTELLNKKIQQIDLCLLKVYLINQAQSALARGSFRREIRYQQAGTPLRKAEDIVQFEINVGELLPEPVSLLKTELKPDYFIFQPGKPDEGPAVLEQGFLLIISMPENQPSGLCKSLQVNSIVEKGKNSLLLNLPVEFPVPLCRPKCFSGKIHFTDTTRLPVVDGEITGVITYRTAENVIRELDFKAPVSLLLNAPVSGPGESLLISGVINDAGWKPDQAGRYWLLNLKLDYQWYLTEPKELLCEENPSKHNRQIREIKASQVLATRYFEFSRTFSIPLPEPAADIDATLENVTHYSKLTWRGLLINAVLNWGVVFIDSGGYEKYQEFQTQIEELFPVNSGDISDKNLVLTTDFKVNPGDCAGSGDGLKINVGCRFSLKLHRSQIATIVEDQTAPDLIHAAVLVGRESFSLPGEEVFALSHCPLQVIRIKTGLLQIDPEARNGWLNISGLMEVVISYVDRQHILREDIFTRYFGGNYIWDKLYEPADVVIEGKLDCDSHELVNSIVIYKYLLNLAAEAFIEREMRIVTVKSPIEQVIPLITTQQIGEAASPAIYNLLIEDEIPLKHGNVKEIISSRASLSRFAFQNSDHAILVCGTLSGELEYWDDKRYLRKEPINLQFWRFIRNDSSQYWERKQLVPEVVNYSCLSSGARFWRKDSIKINFKLVLKQVPGRVKSDESIVTEPK